MQRHAVGEALKVITASENRDDTTGRIYIRDFEQTFGHPAITGRGEFDVCQRIVGMCVEASRNNDCIGFISETGAHRLMR